MARSSRSALRKGFGLSILLAALVRSRWADVGSNDAVSAYVGKDRDAYGATAAMAAASYGSRASPRDIDVRAIAKKWGLITNDAVPLLARQYRRGFDYDADRDFVHLLHLHKTGGTSISDLMEKIFEGSVLPGSHRSGKFDPSEVNDAAAADGGRDAKRRRRTPKYRVSFAHSSLRPTAGPDRTPLAEVLKSVLPRKKLRVITMLRDPVDLRASNHAMWMCHLNAAVRDHVKERKESGLPPQQCDDIDLSALIDLRTESLRKRCAEGTTKGGDKRNCEKIANGIDPFAHCRSVRNLLDSDAYTKHFRNMYKTVMGRYTRSGVIEPMKGFFAHDSSVEKSVTVEEAERYALEDLGGLEPSVETSGEEEDADFVWFGITERMFESTCLFYYTFKVKPLKRVPRARVMGCRPTAWWTQKDRDEVRDKEPLDYAVFRAANAIIDVRLAKMKREIQDQLDGGATLESLQHVAPGCFNITLSFNRVDSR